MKMKTLLGLSAGKTAQLILKKLGRGSTYPGRLALAFDKDILDSLSKDYEIVVITGTNGKTLTTALTVGILKEAFGDVLTNPSGANMITGLPRLFYQLKKENLVNTLLSWKLMKQVFQRLLITSNQVSLSTPIFLEIKWTAMGRFILLIR